MKIILQENVANVGKVGDQVNVKAGFARNFLLPQQKAVLATPANLADFEARRADFEKAAEEKLVQAKQRAEAIAKLSVSIESLASDEGKLFGSIGPRDLADAISSAGIEVAKSEVRMPQGPIRQTGEYDIDLHLHAEVDAVVRVVVVAE